jgi:hypothetical protein
LWWVGGVGPVVEHFAVVVVAQPADKSGAPPVFDGGWSDGELVGEFGGGEHAGVAEALAAAAQPVGVDDVVDDLAVERFSGAGDDAALVEDLGDLAADVMVEQLVDSGDYRGWCLALFGSGFRGGDGEVVC